jgi:diguanylate cyclase (GGDEF)-like protein
MKYNVDFEICAVIFMFLLIILSLTKRRLNDFQSRIFRVYLLCVLFSVSLDIVTCYTIFWHEKVPILLNVILNGIYLLFQCVIPVLISQYVLFCVHPRRYHLIQRWGVWQIPAIACGLLVVTSYWTKWIYYVNRTGYYHGSLHFLLYVNAAIYLFFSIGYVLYYHRELKKRRVFLIVFMIVLSAVLSFLQFLFPSYLLSGVGTALSVYVMYFDLESVLSYEDGVTGALNRTAFNVHIKEHLHRHISEKVFMMGLDNFKIVNETYGMSFGDKLMQQIVSVLQQEYGMNHVFRIGGDKFAVVRREEIETVKILDKLNRILNRTWRVRNAEIEVSACICLVHSGRHGEEDVIHAMDYAMMRAKKMGKGRFLEVDDEIIEDMERRAQIEHALVSAIESKHFEVHYQPIFDTHSKRFHSMEALARLSVPGYGYVSPEEFILVAEQNGTILTVGLLVLEEVCRFIREYDLKQRGIDFIEVNLSVVQCMQERLFEEVTALLKQYDIPPEMINLEITESAEAYSEERLVRNMARLSLTDITFSLDDYGSGYSNINYLVDLPFSIVKIDKYIVWAAMKKVASRRVLENTIAMCKNINLKVVTEGIENPDMMNMVIDMGADYLQGYYFSKPVTREKVIECLEEGYLEKLLTK